MEKTKRYYSEFLNMVKINRSIIFKKNRLDAQTKRNSECRRLR
jgi:hypothetical protein